MEKSAQGSSGGTTIKPAIGAVNPPIATYSLTPAAPTEKLANIDLPAGAGTTSVGRCG